MGCKNFVYVTDNKKRYLVRLDAAISTVPVLGFTLATDLDKDLDYLPRYLKMRNIGCNVDKNSLVPGGSFRTFAVGSPTASILTKTQPFSYKGVGYMPRRFHPEQRRKQQTRS